MHVEFISRMSDGDGARVIYVEAPGVCGALDLISVIMRSAVGKWPPAPTHGDERRSGAAEVARDGHLSVRYLSTRRSGKPAL